MLISSLFLGKAYFSGSVGQTIHHCIEDRQLDDKRFYLMFYVTKGKHRYIRLSELLLTRVYKVKRTSTHSCNHKECSL